MTEIERRNLRVQVASGDALDVRQFTVEERLSALFSITLLVTSENADIDFEAVVGKDASFTIHGGAAGLVNERTWRGVCSRLRLVAAEDTGVSSYHLTLVPSLWLATQRRNYRMFQHVSEPDIALALLAEWGVEVERRLTAEHKKRKYRVQYGESDFAFLCRMLEEAGVTFFFEDRGDRTVLVLSDAPQRGEPRPAPLPFLDSPTAADREHATDIRLDRQVRPGRFTIRDHDYRKPPEYKLLATAATAGVEERLESFDYVPGAFLFGTDKGESTPIADDRGRARTDEVEGAILAQKRLDAGRGTATVCSFATNAIDVAPGTLTRFFGHPRRDLGPDREWLITQVTRGGSHDSEWIQHAEARSAAHAYRPEVVTPRPRVSGVESATVVGPAGEEIHCDEFGRVRVHFHWDRESRMNEQSSCWIHVSQAWGGAGYGGMNLPRVGQEVLVDFLGGDPDRPVIVGRLYTNLQKVPYGLPHNKTQSGIKSNSTGGTGGFNELMFEDAAGNELVRMQAEKDMHRQIKNDDHHTVGRDHRRAVKRNQSSTVGKNRTRTVKKNERVSIGQSQTITVGGNRTAHVGGTDAVTAGTMHVATVSDLAGGTGTKVEITNHMIVLDSGRGAKIAIVDDRIIVEASTIDIIAGTRMSVGVATGELAIHGGPNVVINGPGPLAARKNDPVGGKILDGSPTVFIGPAPPPPKSDEETISQAIERIAASDFGKTEEGKKVLAKLEQLRKEGKIKFANLGPSTRGESGDDGVTVSDGYNRDPDTTASELVHEVTHQIDTDEYPGKTGNSIDEEMRTNSNQLDFYEEQRRDGYRDPELEMRRNDRAKGKLRENIRSRYPTSPENRPR